MSSLTQHPTAMAEELEGLLYGTLDLEEVEPSRPNAVLTGDPPLWLQEDFAAFPLLLTKGPGVAWQPTLEWLQKRFDCCMAPLRLAPRHLAHLAAEWSAKGGGRPFELHYALPKEIQNMNTVTLNIPDDALQRLYQALPPEDGTEKQPLLLTAVQEHFWAHFKVDLSGASLQRLGCAAALVDGSRAKESKPSESARVWMN